MALSSRNLEQAETSRYLAAFDFDQTIVNENTDTVVRSLLQPNQISTGLEKVIETHSWTHYMAEIFRILHKIRMTPTKIRETVTEMNEVPGMVRLLKTLHANNFDLIIISDSNTEFIEQWNARHGLTNTFLKIYTNPAEFNNDGLLKIEPYDHQTECVLSAVNICKGKVLHQFIQERKLNDNICYRQTFYVGDGSNDICPLLRLTKCDYGCARSGYSMEKQLPQILGRYNFKLQAQILLWSDGFDLLSKILEVVKK